MKILMVILVVLVGLAFVLHRAVNKTDVEPDQACFGRSDSDAFFMARHFVEDQLKAPATAKFGSRDEATISRVACTWTVRGTVDAQNSFGALMRSDFTVVTRPTSSTMWHADRVEVVAR